ncbi:MAG: rod shape-determining protein MreC [Clostridia bacterium]|nr:rod shape-determining protein MreC [Clostridia bacterium]
MKHKFFIVCVCIGLCAALFTGVFAVMGWGDLLRQVGGGILYPFQWTARQIGRGFSGFGRYFADVRGMQDEIESLRAENESLRADLIDAELIRQEDRWLYAYLSMKEEHDDWQLCAASVTATVWSDGYATELTLNKGRSAGIQTGMPVVTTEGLVGVVCETGLAYCKVRTILDTDHAAGACLPRSGEAGMIEGSFTELHDGKLVLRYLDAEADAQTGDVCVTSGRGTVYPYGIPAGTVESVSANAYTRTTEAVIVPFCDFSDLDQVMILTAYEHTTGEGGP